MAKLQYFADHRHATWLELFFDLVFVASIGIITHNLAHTHDGHMSSHQLLQFPIEFIPIWWIWASHTLYSNRFDTDSKPHRVSTLSIMFLMVSMTAFLSNDLYSDYALFLAFYVAIRLILAGLYFVSMRKHDDCATYARSMGVVGIVGTAVSSVSFLFDSPFREAVFVGGVLLEMIVVTIISRKVTVLAVHRGHLVERIGLLTIIILGESVISLVAGLRDIEWNPLNVSAALTGFLMLGAIWWIYFDSFDVLERAKRLQSGFAVLYSHVLVYMGLIILANLIRHAILGDLGQDDFRVLAIAGMVSLYIGKQTGYFVAFPIYRVNNIVNSTICIAVTVAATYLSRPEYTLMGMTLGMFFYVYSNFRWTLTKDAAAYLVEAES